MLVCVIANNLYRVLVSTYSTICAKSVELSLKHTLAAKSNLLFLRQRCKGYIINHTYAELVFRLVHCKVLIYCKYLGWGGVLRAETVAAAYYKRSVLLAVKYLLNIKIHRLSVSTWLFCTVKHCNTFCCGRKYREEVFCRERTIQVNCNKSDLLTLGCKIVNSFTNGLCNRTHCNYNTVSIRCSVVVEQAILTSCDF